MHPERKKNRLADYSYSQPGAYFITVCTKEKVCILSKIVGADAHIGPQPNPNVGADAHIGPKLTGIGLIVEKYLRSIPGVAEYVIMPNHVHVILRISAENMLDGPVWEDAPTKASVSSLIRSWKVLVSKEVGQSIWQRSYYDHIIRNEREYVEIAEYIQNNPIRWCDDCYYL